MQYSYGIIGLFFLVACLSDVRHGRIPNGLTLVMAVGGLVLAAAVGGLDGGLTALAGLGAGLGVFLPFWLFGMLGAGDVKLMAATGAWLGPGQVLEAALLACLVGGVYSLAVLAFNRRGDFFRALASLPMLVMTLKAGDVLTSEGIGESAGRMHYALAIAGGTAASVILRESGMTFLEF
jgi:prepilin peptidase CpaA